MLKAFLLQIVSREGRWALVTAGLLVCAYCVVTFHRDAPDPLPPRVASRVQEHVIQSAVDSTEIQRLDRSAASVRVKGDTAEARAERAADSCDYRVAYVEEDSAVLSLEHQVGLLDVALTRSQTWGIRGDSVVAELLPLIQAREEPCRILWVVPCPTRRAVAVAAAAITAGVILGGGKRVGL